MAVPVYADQLDGKVRLIVNVEDSVTHAGAKGVEVIVTGPSGEEVYRVQMPNESQNGTSSGWVDVVPGTYHVKVVENIFGVPWSLNDQTIQVLPETGAVRVDVKIMPLEYLSLPILFAVAAISIAIALWAVRRAMMKNQMGKRSKEIKPQPPRD